MMMDDKNARDYHQPYEPTVLERGDQVSLRYDSAGW